MNAIARLKKRIKATPLAIPYIAAVNRFGKRRNSQSDEAAVIDRLIAAVNPAKYFIEFGFGGWEFNCINLAADREWQGLLLDGDAYNVTIARTIYHRGIRAEKRWLTLEGMDYIREQAAGRRVGILSVDVDGNDYWFLQRLIDLQPDIVSCEINVCLGLRSITVPYDPEFDRAKKHESWEYYGVSLSALHHLCRRHGYNLVAMSGNGVNAFFVRDQIRPESLPALSPEQALRPKTYPDGRIAASAEAWEKIKHMPFVDVSA